MLPVSLDDKFVNMFDYCNGHKGYAVSGSDFSFSQKSISVDDIFSVIVYLSPDDLFSSRLALISLRDGKFLYISKNEEGMIDNGVAYLCSSFEELIHSVLTFEEKERLIENYNFLYLKEYGSDAIHSGWAF